MLDALNSILSLLLVAIGLYFAHNFRRQLALKVVDRRVESYSRLWAIMEVSGPWRAESGRGPMSGEERRELYGKMTRWYFGDGSGMLLMPVTRELYLNAKFNMICPDDELRLDLHRDALREFVPEESQRREDWRGELSMKQLSLLRAQMRADLQVFGLIYAGGLEPLDKAFLRMANVDLNKPPWTSPGSSRTRQFRLNDAQGNSSTP